VPIINRKGRTPSKSDEAVRTESMKGVVEPVKPVVQKPTLKACEMPPQPGDDEPVDKSKPNGPTWGHLFGRKPAPVEPKKPITLPPPTKEEQAKAVAFNRDREKPAVLKWLDGVKACVPSMTSAEESDVVAVGVRSSAADRETLLRIFRRCAASKK